MEGFGIHTGGPASLASSNVDLVSVGTGNLLDVRHGTRHIVKVGLVGLVGSSSLPVGKGIGQDVGDKRGRLGIGGEEVVGSTVGELVPAVGGTNGDALELVGDETNVVVQGRTGLVTAVKGLGADGDGLDHALVAGDGLLQGSEVLCEGLVLGAQVIGILCADPKERFALASRGPWNVECGFWGIEDMGFLTRYPAQP